MLNASLLNQLIKYEIYKTNSPSGIKYGIRVIVNSDYLFGFYFKSQSTAEELVDILNTNTVDVSQAPYIIQDYIWDRLRQLSSQTDCIDL